MNALYFDCFSGISGDMTVGALLDLGIVSLEELKLELGKLNLSDEFSVSAEKTEKNAIYGTQFHVQVHEHHHHHEEGADAHREHHHHGRSMADIEHIISNCALNDHVKRGALDIFRIIAQAEGAVHNKPVSEVHFHEVGAVDSIVDITACAILLDRLNVEKVFCSFVSEGFGFTHCQHGMIPVPVPAVANMFASYDVPVRQTEIESELVTPTGAGILCALASSFGRKPQLRNAKVGYGAGQKEFTTPNLLRIYFGELDEDADSVYVLETNLDDMTGEDMGYAMERIFSSGALDVFYTPIYMKKNRPGVKLTALCRETELDQVENAILRYTSTFGIRFYKADRKTLNREITRETTPWGEVSVKHGKLGDIHKFHAEAEEVEKIAQEQDVLPSEVRKTLIQ